MKEIDNELNCIVDLDINVETELQKAVSIFIIYLKVLLF